MYAITDIPISIKQSDVSFRIAYLLFDSPMKGKDCYLI